MPGASVLTVKKALDAIGGLGEGFDSLRVASATVLSHSAMVTGNLEEAAGGPFWLGVYVLVQAFSL